MLGTEKVVLSEMTVPGSDRRIYSITKKIGMVVTGIIPDGRALVEKARSESATFQESFGFPISGKVLAERIAQHMYENTIYPSARPFGCTAIIASFEESKGPALYSVDASGLCYGYFGCAWGKGRQTARNEIEKLEAKKIPCKDAAFSLAKM
jgi:20S proteasome subunit alpha 7